ncbi:MAG TPA: fumarylacetoacetate hydrolase family protein [Acidimicrobiia bacterium]|nr:fumarylacetoacetate hydrolase family protein [Acidimicrobiia bacterium]
MVDFPPGVHPYCVFSVGGCRRRIGVAAGGDLLDLSAVAETLESVDPAIVLADRLNPLLASGRAAWEALAEEIRWRAAAGFLERGRRSRHGLVSHLAWEVTDFVDFYSSRRHAETVGRLFRPDAAPLPANWLSLPMGYHARSATVVVDGTPIRRPRGQARSEDGSIRFGPSRKLDFEVEVGYVVGGSTGVGESIDVADVDDHLFGVVLVNDWSARDIQALEYVPLGPFLGKSFATSVSAWVMPMTALAGARVPAPSQTVEPAAYLRAAEPWTLDLSLEVAVRPSGEGERITLASVGTAAGVYWTPAQQLAHLTVNGAAVRPGDLFATGTVSGPGPDGGCLLELTSDGAAPLDLGNATRTYLEDGDEVIITGRATTEQGAIPLGPVSGSILPT